MPVLLPKYPVSSQDLEDLNKRFTHHPPSNDQPARYELLRAEAKRLATILLENVPASRERSLALTHLEEVVMWANAGIARNELAGPPAAPDIFKDRIASIGG